MAQAKTNRLLASIAQAKTTRFQNSNAQAKTTLLLTSIAQEKANFFYLFMKKQIFFNCSSKTEACSIGEENTDILLLLKENK